MIEVAVKISNDEQKYTQRFLAHEPFLVSTDDLVLSQMVNEALANFKGDHSDIDIRIKMPW